MGVFYENVFATLDTPVYMSCTEEILSSTAALWWSPDSRYICYATFNDTKVPLFRFPYYGPRSDLYGDIIEFAYPKVYTTFSPVIRYLCIAALNLLRISRRRIIQSRGRKNIDHNYVV